MTGLINHLVFYGVILGVLSHIIDILYLSVVICLCPFAEHGETLRTKSWQYQHFIYSGGNACV